MEKKSKSNIASKNSNILLYTSPNGNVKIEVFFKRETVWLTQRRLADLFGVKIPAINKHLSNIFQSGELSEESVISILETTAEDGKKYNTKFYNLDTIISVGYRVNSVQATHFRIWATKTLRHYILDGFAINKNRIAKNYQQFLNVVSDIRALLPAGSTVKANDAVELISLFADTWLSLSAYDKDALPKRKLTKKKVTDVAVKITAGLTKLKSTLIGQSAVTEMFGCERTPDAVAGIVGNIMQTFGGKEVYPTIEEKAAHLLYFMVKNHPFTDGNKRSGAFAFVWFLKQAELLDTQKLTPAALTALTVLVAESNPSHKDKIIKLILNLLTNG